MSSQAEGNDECIIYKTEALKRFDVTAGYWWISLSIWRCKSAMLFVEHASYGHEGTF
jgi:hypothetical protein